MYILKCLSNIKYVTKTVMLDSKNRMITIKTIDRLKRKKTEIE